MERSTAITVDLAADPFVPEGWTVVEHRPGLAEAKLEKRDGKLYLNGKQVVLHLDEGQQNGNAIGGNNLRKKFEGQPILNANLLDFLLANPNLIPEDWREVQGVFFWGTIYRNSLDCLYVRCLCWSGDRLRPDYDWLEHRWSVYYPAAVLDAA